MRTPLIAGTVAPLVGPRQSIRDVNRRQRGKTAPLRFLQRTWVATDLHQQVWPQMESHCADYSVQDYTSV